jgi:hypothetical protein
MEIRLPQRQKLMRGQESKPVLGLALVASAILLLCAACAPGAEQLQRSLQLTSAALDARSTALAMEATHLAQPTEAPPTQPPTEEPSPTAPPPTAEPTVSPYVEGSMVRAAYDPAADWGDPTVFEDFEGSSGFFNVKTGEAANSWYGEGRFNITFTTRGKWTWYFANPILVDFYADVLVFNGEQCVETDSAGLFFHADEAEDFGMMFGVTCGGEYYLGGSGGPGPGGEVCSMTNNYGSIECSGIIVTRQSEYIDAGPGAVNRLGVMTEGTHFDFYINGQHVDGFTNPWAGTYFDRGLIALFLGTGQKDNAMVQFDDFSLWTNP